MPPGFSATQPTVHSTSGNQDNHPPVVAGTGLCSRDSSPACGGIGSPWQSCRTSHLATSINLRFQPLDLDTGRLVIINPAIQFQAHVWIPDQVGCYPPGNAVTGAGEVGYNAARCFIRTLSLPRDFGDPASAGSSFMGHAAPSTA